MEKVFYSVADVAAARAVLDRLHELDVPDTAIALVAPTGTQMENFPDAVLENATDIGPAAARGAAIGGSLGLIGSLLVAAFPPTGVILGGAALLAATAGGALMGAWSATLIGATIPNEAARHFESELERGRILIAVEWPDLKPASLEHLPGLPPGAVRRLSVPDDGEA